MKYIEVKFSVVPKEPATDILIAQLNDYGFESFEETETGVNAYIKSELFADDFHESVFILNSHFNIYYEKKEMEQKNWNEVWEKNFEPVLIEDKCCIRASFHKKPEAVLYDIVINPKMSFGTGHHQTTYLMVQEMLKLDIENKSVVDAGCGTAILAILASMMNAKSVFAYDIDEWPVENGRENIQINKAKNIQVYKGASLLLQGKVFNVILANINKNVLKSDMKQFSASLEKGGDLLLSGFFVHDNEELVKTAIENGFHYFSSSFRDNWSLLHFKK